jgi:cellobiose phosphorylase
MYRIWIEEVLGFQRRGKSLVVRPMIPPGWQGFNMTYRFEKTVYRISVTRSGGSPRVELDGAVLPDGVIPLSGDGVDRHVTVHL